MVCDDKGRPLLLHLAEGQANDHKTAAAVIDQLPPAPLRARIVPLDILVARPIKLEVRRSSFELLMVSVAAKA